jgi:hypothetical protein
MKKEDIDILICKYMNGYTDTLEEECLREMLSKTIDHPEWDIYRIMLSPQTLVYDVDAILRDNESNLYENIILERGKESSTNLSHLHSRCKRFKYSIAALTLTVLICMAALYNKMHRDTGTPSICHEIGRMANQQSSSITPTPLPKVKTPSTSSQTMPLAETTNCIKTNHKTLHPSITKTDTSSIIQTTPANAPTKQTIDAIAIDNDRIQSTRRRTSVSKAFDESTTYLLSTMNINIQELQ